MLIFLVIRETKLKLHCGYGDHDDCWETETDVISAHRNVDDAIKMVQTETDLETDKNVEYHWEPIELS